VREQHRHALVIMQKYPQLLQKRAMCTLCIAPLKRPERESSMWCTMPTGSCVLVTEPLARPLASVRLGQANYSVTWREKARSACGPLRRDR
jgi:hypothetical protein